MYIIITKTFLFNIYRLSPIKPKEIIPERTQEKNLKEHKKFIIDLQYHLEVLIIDL